MPPDQRETAGRRTSTTSLGRAHEGSARDAEEIMKDSSLRERPSEDASVLGEREEREEAGEQRSTVTPPPTATTTLEGLPLHSSPDRRLSQGVLQQLNDVQENKHASLRGCGICGKPMTKQFVRALGGTFHLDCFRCKDCNCVVASKFFPVDAADGTGQYALCETDYFRRLDLLCEACGGALRGSYITALDRKYHIEHFTCSMCPTLFGPQDSYYEHDGKVYCHFHYSTKFAVKCHGCQTAILKQFVEIFRNGLNQHWHPECYMIHKFWNVKLASRHDQQAQSAIIDTATPDEIRQREQMMEDKVYRIWSVLSSYEETTAACISDMLLHVSNGAYIEGVVMAEKFIGHVEILFASIDKLEASLLRVSGKTLPYHREAKMLCKKIVAFFALLSKTQETGVRKLGITQELLSLVTGLAHYLKILIRISLTAALKLERDHQGSHAIRMFLAQMLQLKGDEEEHVAAGSIPSVTSFVSAEYADVESDLCTACGVTIEDDCAKLGDKRWHLNCLSCCRCGNNLKRESQEALWSDDEQKVFCQGCGATVPESRTGFQHITKLTQFVFLLRVALSRLYALLRQGPALPHTSDDPNLERYDSTNGIEAQDTGAPLLTPGSRSRSYAGERVQPKPRSYVSTLNDIRRLKSSRMDEKLTNSARRARQSTIFDGPEGMSAESLGSGSTSPRLEQSLNALSSRARNSQFRIVEDNESGPQLTASTFAGEKTLTLDDIPRLVAAEQAREQRPNAFKHQTHRKIPSNAPNQPRLVQPGHRTGSSTDTTPAHVAAGMRQRTYVSELSALEYFIVRHIAVLSLAELVKDSFNLEELLDLIEVKKATFWGKFGKALKGGNAEKKKKDKKGVFAVPLEVIVERDGTESALGAGPNRLRVPSFVDDAISAMKQMDMSVEGVFRKNGNIRRLKDLADAIDKNTAHALIEEGPVQLAALLKKFLRDLPDPLLTHKLHKLFITSQRLEDEDVRRRVLHLTCCLLPKPHRDTMEIIFFFLNWVASFSHVDEESGSKMDIHNLATVITPNILYADSKDAAMDESFLAIEAVHSLIEYNEEFSLVPEDILMLLHDQELFSGSAELTTKDILRRCEEALSRPPKSATESSGTTGASTSGSMQRPRPQRIDTGYAQEFASKQESTARRTSTSVLSYEQTNNSPKTQYSYESNGASSQKGKRSNGYPS
ncbi:Rho-type GTPase activating protein Rga1 [Saitoella coloradoensis]